MFSLGILKYWQGIVEVILRVIVIVLLVIVFICAAAVVGALSHSTTPFQPIESLRFNSRSPSGWILLVTMLGTPYSIFYLVLRFLEVNCVVSNVKVFLIIDVVANIFLAISLFCGAVPMGFYRDQWIGYINQGTAEEIRRYNLNGIATTMGASAGFSFLCMFVVVALVVWLILTVVLDWGNNSKPTYRKNDFAPKVSMVTSETEEPKVDLSS